MNHSDQSTSEDNFEPRTDSRHSSSYASKKKQVKKVESTSTDEILDVEQSEFPQSIERTRYNQTNDEGLLAAILDPQRIYTKEIQYQDQQITKKSRGLNIFDRTSERSRNPFIQSNNKKTSKRALSPFQSSFDDRISIQTMDSKQFSESFEYSERQLIQMGSYSKQTQGKSFTKHTSNDKNYFDNHIIEHVNEQDEQREQKNAYICEQPDDSRLIELQNPQNHQQKFTEMNKKSQKKQSSSIKQLDHFETKNMVRQKQNQIKQLKQAFVQTCNQNDVLKNRIKQLQACLQAIVQQKQQESNLFKNPQFQINQEDFKKTVKIFRKFSL